jgi:pSer/pThr/pTyr-binding forkhead associated (FHA) protein
MPKIFVLSGPDVGMSFEVQEGASFGRASECAVPLRHASVSRHHAHVEVDGGSWWIVDDGSRNGLTVRGERVPRAPVADGDEFQLGEVLLRFRLAGATAAAHPRASDVADDRSPAVIHDVRPAVASDEIVIEGDWESQETMPPRQMNITGPAMPAPAPPQAPLVETPRMETARQRATEKLRAAGAMPAAVTGSRGVLQYNKVEAREGFAASDLGQQPWWIKAAVLVLVTLVCAVVAWLAFRGTIWMRGGPTQPPAVEEDG